MSLPIFVNAQTGATDAGGAWAYTGQASQAAGRVFIAHILQDGTTNAAISAVIGTNIENLAGTDNVWTQISGPLVNGTWAVGGAEEALQLIFIGRALSTSAPTISGANSTLEDLYIMTYQFAGVSLGTTLADVIENVTAGSAVNSTGTSATVSDASTQTLGPDRLALNLLAINDDNPFAGFTGETGGDWTTRASYADSSGTDGAIYLSAADMLVAGTIDGGTGSITDSDSWGVVGFALKPQPKPDEDDLTVVYQQAVGRGSVWFKDGWRKGREGMWLPQLVTA